MILTEMICMTGCVNLQACFELFCAWTLAKYVGQPPYVPQGAD
jgi:hypothetical protein